MTRFDPGNLHTSEFILNFERYIFAWKSSMSKRLRANRIRECANPLYLKWLEEWRDEAREKGSKMQHTYSKVSLLTLTFELYLFSI